MHITSFTEIWRYMDFWKLEAILNGSAIYMPTVDSFRDSDPNEGRFFAEYLEVQRRAARLRYRDKDALKHVDEHCSLLKSVRHHSYVSCWTYQGESREMWDGFTQPEHIGVAIRSTIALVSNEIRTGVKALPASSDFWIDERPISYDREKSHLRLTMENVDDFFFPLFSLSGDENENFCHEAEYRFVALYYEGAIWESIDRIGQRASANARRNARKTASIPDGIEVPADPKNFILEVLLRPGSTMNEYGKVEQTLMDAGLKDCKLNFSKL